jgi:hypothetical protein
MPDAVPLTTPHAPVAPARRPWNLPRLVELPKLTSLTLASAIGGGGGTGGGGSTVFGLFLAVGMLLGLGGCSADDVDGTGNVRPEPLAMRAVTCHATVGSAEVRCELPQAVGGRELLGGQGSYIALRSSNITSAAGVFTADVTVQNLSAQPIGTDDGTTKSGLYVFFVSGPTVTGGTGNVSVANESGIDEFTALGQPYFAYDTILGGLEESLPMTWEWNYDVGVTDFAFTVLVAADVPELGGILRWNPVVDGAGIGGFDVRSFTVNGPNDLMAVGDAPAFLRFTGGEWGVIPSPFVNGLLDVTAGGADTYFGVGIDQAADKGYAARFNGKVWTKIGEWPGLYLTTAHSPDGSQFFFGGGTPTGDAVLIGFNGMVWVGDTLAGVGKVTVIEGSSSSYLVAGTETGAFLEFDGTDWTVAVPPVGADHPVTSIAVGPPGFFFAGGYDASGMFPVAWISQYASGTETPLATRPMARTAGLALLSEALVMQIVGFDLMGNEYTAFHGWDGGPVVTIDSVAGRYEGLLDAGDGAFLMSSGRGLAFWGLGGGVTQLQGVTGEGEELNAVVTIGSTVYVGTETGAVVKFDGSSWSREYISAARIEALWAFSASDVYAAGAEGMFHYDGTSWSPVPLAEVGTEIQTMWGTGSTLFASKSDTVFMRSGGVWSPITDPAVVGSYFEGIWGSSATDVYFVGYQYTMVHFDGVTWSDVALPALPVGWDPASTPVWTVGGTSANDLWVGVDGGIVHHWNGTTWDTFEIPSGDAVESIHPLGVGRALLGTSDGVFLGTTNGVVPFSSTAIDASVGLVPAGTDLWAVGTRELFRGER